MWPETFEDLRLSPHSKARFEFEDGAPFVHDERHPFEDEELRDFCITVKQAVKRAVKSGEGRAWQAVSEGELDDSGGYGGRQRVGGCGEKAEDRV